MTTLPTIPPEGNSPDRDGARLRAYMAAMSAAAGRLADYAVQRALLGDVTAAKLVCELANLPSAVEKVQR